MFDELKILAPFQNIYDNIEIEKLGYKSFLANKDKYSDEFKADQKAKYIAGVKKVVKEAADQVRANIEEAKKALTTIEMQGPPTFEGEPKNETEQLSRHIELLHFEMQKQNDFNIFNFRVSNARTAEELEALYQENKTNPTFKMLFDEEMRKRISDSSTGTSYSALQHKLNKEPEEFARFRKIEYQLQFFENEKNHHFPTGLENGLEQAQLTSIWDGVE